MGPHVSDSDVAERIPTCFPAPFGTLETNGGHEITINNAARGTSRGGSIRNGEIDRIDPLRNTVNTPQRRNRRVSTAGRVSGFSARVKRRVKPRISRGLRGAG